MAQSEDDAPKPPVEIDAKDQAAITRATDILGVHFDDFLVVVRPKGCKDKDSRLVMRWSNTEWASGAACTAGESVEEKRRA